MEHMELTQHEYDKLMAFVFEAKEKGTHFAGQTFEDGIEAVIDVMQGNLEVEEVIE